VESGRHEDRATIGIQIAGGHGRPVSRRARHDLRTPGHIGEWSLAKAIAGRSGAGKTSLAGRFVGIHGECGLQATPLPFHCRPDIGGPEADHRCEYARGHGVESIAASPVRPVSIAA